MRKQATIKFLNFRKQIQYSKIKTIRKYYTSQQCSAEAGTNLEASLTGGDFVKKYLMVIGDGHCR